MLVGAVPQPESRAPYKVTEPIKLEMGETVMSLFPDDQFRISCTSMDKRGRFITNMGFANFVTAAVDSADERIKGSCMIILEETDPGTFDRGTPTKKLVHQLSSTCDPVFNLKIPASRIIGGYTVKDGVIVPRHSHAEIIEAVNALRLSHGLNPLTIHPVLIDPKSGFGLSKNMAVSLANSFHVDA